MLEVSPASGWIELDLIELGEIYFILPEDNTCDVWDWKFDNFSD